jgi:hypothetical protein
VVVESGVVVASASDPNATVLTKELLENHFLMIEAGELWRELKDILALPVTPMAQPLAPTPDESDAEEASQKRGFYPPDERAY